MAKEKRAYIVTDDEDMAEEFANDPDIDVVKLDEEEKKEGIFKRYPVLKFVLGATGIGLVTGALGYVFGRKNGQNAALEDMSYSEYPSDDTYIDDGGDEA